MFNQFNSEQNIELILNYISEDRFNKAIDLCLKKIELDTINVDVKIYLGLCHLLDGNEEDAQSIWLDVMLNDRIEQENTAISRLIHFLEKEAFQRFENHKAEQARIICFYLLEIDNKNEIAYKTLGDIYLQVNNLEDAISNYKKTLDINPENHDVIFRIALLFKLSGELEKSETEFQKLVHNGLYLNQVFIHLKDIYETKGDLLNSSLYYGLHLVMSRRYTEASEILIPLLSKNFQKERVYWIISECYTRSGKNQALFNITEQSTELFPEDLKIAIKSKLTLPIQYNNIEEISLYRERFTQSLNYFNKNLDCNLSKTRDQILNALESHTNFFLPYQGCNDLELQKTYASLARQVMALNFPAWAKPLSIQNYYHSRKLKIGYLSHHFFEHTVCKLFKGWIKYANRNKFEISIYYTGKNYDEHTKEIQDNCDYFYDMSMDFKEICKKIYEDQLDILVYPEVGMNSKVFQLATLRLAPIQCMAWGHPVTSGLPTIDYFLSSELMETSHSQEYYHENLICLPNLSIAYENPKVPSEPLTRYDFGIKEDEIVYLCCQSTYKYLPQYDYIFPKIAQHVSNSKFLFITTYNEELTQKFRDRLSRSFADYNLNFKDFCLDILPQDNFGYFSLNLISDIFLDTIDWSGGNTTLEAIACNLPVVTHPGEFMRGRHSYAILKQLGITETIAKSIDDYINIAIKLGINLDFRQYIIQKISDFKFKLYEDKTCVEALEKFYEESIISYSLLSK